MLFSYKNIFLIGLINFQSLSGALICLTGVTERGADLRDPDSAAGLFSLVLTIFVAVFLWLYPRMGLASRLAAKKCKRRSTQPFGVAVAGTIMLLIGVVAKLVAPNLGLLGVLLLQMSAGAICGGIGMLNFAWARSPMNAILGALALIALGAGSAVLSVGAFGRRDLLSAAVVVPFAWYFAR